MVFQNCYSKSSLSLQRREEKNPCDENHITVLNSFQCLLMTRFFNTLISEIFVLLNCRYLIGYYQHKVLIIVGFFFCNNSKNSLGAIKKIFEVGTGLEMILKFLDNFYDSVVFFQQVIK